MRHYLLAVGLTLVLCLGGAAHSQNVQDVVGDTPVSPGLVDLYADPARGTVHMALPAPDEKGVIGTYLYTARLARGLGSNPVGLDRAGAGVTHILTLRRIGGRVIAEARNPRYRASAGGLQAASVDESFATSVLWAAPIAAEREDGALLVDGADFLVRDAVGIAARLKAADQGGFTLDKERSFVRAGAALAFPDNVEIQALLTFSGENPGDEIRQTTPDPEAITLGVHHSLVELPDDGFTPRPWDPRTGGLFPATFADYSTPLDAPLITRYAMRHRLEKTEPDKAASPVENPIVYYVDPATPEPVRGALIDGASWWAEAFERAGFQNAFRVEVLPADAHPMDIRYNMINWVHRQTRGWSYGAAVVDPRTGEIIKGNVMLGSLRVRQDRMIFEALTGRAAARGPGATGTDPVEVALDRIRQLAAHEVGHTLGLAHNFAGSTYDRASVMDYPAPMIGIDGDGNLDFSNAYDAGIGAWDAFAIRWLYAPVPDDQDPRQYLNDLARDAYDRGLIYITDSNARSTGTAHPQASLWDNGSDPARQLSTVMQVRAIGLENFSEAALAPGRDQSDLRRLFVPLYLYHRYQVAAAAKVLGGRHFVYAAADDDRPDVRLVEASRQEQALNALVKTLRPDALAIPDSTADALVPRHGRPMDLPFRRETFASHMGEIFDRWSAVDVAAGLTLDALLHPARAGRLRDQHHRNGGLPGLADVFETLDAVCIDAVGDEETTEQAAIRGRVAMRYVAGLIDLAGNPDADPDVRAHTEHHLSTLQKRLSGREQALSAHLARQIGRYFDAPADNRPLPEAPKAPPGSPIGQAGGWPVYESCWHCPPARR